MTLLLIALRSTLILAVFLGCLPLLRKHAGWKFQRAFLLTGLLSGFLPWVIHFLPESGLHFSALDPVLITGEALLNQAGAVFDWSVYLWPTYWAGVAASFLLLVREIIQLRHLFKGAHLVKQGKMTLVYTRQQQHSIFSWWKYLFIPQTNDNSGISEAILHHELEHIRARHSIDKLLMQLFVAFQWFNPLVYFYRTALRDLHEYEADAAAIRSTNTGDYATQLLAQALHTPDFVLVNHLVNHSTQLKKRLKMMQKNSLRKGNAWLPAGLFLVAISLSAMTAFAGNPIEKRLKTLARLQSETEQVAKEAEKMPQYKGGTKGLMDFMAKNVKYPEAARKDSLTGTVIMKFVIDTDGKVTNLRVGKGVHPLLDEAALSALHKMERWTPGETKGKKVKVEMALPIKFALK